MTIIKKFYIKSLKYKFVYLILSVLFGILLFYISTLPHSKIKSSSYPQISDIFDMMNHFFGFALFNFFLFSFLLGISPQRIEGRMIILYFTIAIPWGVFCEGVQYFIDSQSFQYIDIMANTLPSPIISIILLKMLKNVDNSFFSKDGDKNSLKKIFFLFFLLFVI